jgi:hypothetical protein
MKLRKRNIPSTNEVVSDVCLRAGMAENAIMNLATSTTNIKERYFLPCRARHTGEYQEYLEKRELDKILKTKYQHTVAAVQRRSLRYKPISPTLERDAKTGHTLG